MTIELLARIAVGAGQITLMREDQTNFHTSPSRRRIDLIPPIYMSWTLQGWFPSPRNGRLPLVCRRSALSRELYYGIGVEPMAQSTKKRSSSKSKKKKTTSKSSNKKSETTLETRSGAIWEEALELELRLEEKLLRDAIQNATLAVKELESETRNVPFERRSGLRLKEKALKAERAFNRLRALRQGKLLPEAHPDD